MAEASEKAVLEIVGITEEELVTEKIKDLNKLLKLKKVSKPDAKKLKELRRRLLNRGYANKSRVKKDDTDSALKKENKIYEEINKLNKSRLIGTTQYDKTLNTLIDNNEKELKELYEILLKEKILEDEKLLESFEKIDIDQIPDSEGEESYNNNNDIKKKIEVCRKLSNFDEDQQDQLSKHIDMLFEKLKNISDDEDEGDDIEEQEEFEIVKQEVIENESSSKDLGLPKFGAISAPRGLVSLNGFYREEEMNQRWQHLLGMSKGLLSEHESGHNTYNKRLKLLEEEKEEMSHESKIHENFLKNFSK